MKGRLPAYRDSFFCSPDRPDGIQLAMTYEDRSVLCDMFVDNRFEGYTNVVHGGMVFGILDVMIWYAIFMETKKICMTRRTDSEFLKPVMCNEVYKAKARFRSMKGRDVLASAWVENKDGDVCAKVEAVFREARDIPPRAFMDKFDFSYAAPEITAHFLSRLDEAPEEGG